MKKLVIAFLTLATASVGSLQAQTLANCVVVETTGGERMEYLLSDLPRITQSADVVVLTTANATVELQSSEIVKIYLSATEAVDPTDVGRMKTADGSFSISGDCVQLSGYQAGEWVSLYSADGRLLRQLSVGIDGSLIISLASQSSGIFIIKTNHQFIKIIRK